MDQADLTHMKLGDRTTASYKTRAICRIFKKHGMPWENLVSVLLDSCNIMRGFKKGRKQKLRQKAPHLVDIDGDVCHHVHNASRKFCASFRHWLEGDFGDLHTNFRYSTDQRDLFCHKTCPILNFWCSLDSSTLEGRKEKKRENQKKAALSSKMCQLSKKTAKELMVERMKKERDSFAAKQMKRKRHLALAKLSAAKKRKRMFKDHLVGGIRANLNPDDTKLASVPKSNKYAECVFGLLGHLITHKPDISTLASEAYLMYAQNRTSKWLKTQSPEEVNEEESSQASAYRHPSEKVEALKAQLRFRQKVLDQRSEELQVYNITKLLNGKRVALSVDKLSMSSYWFNRQLSVPLLT
ncbi:hypothetical protein CAPTEDRAFT_190074 [Capitella teleta]|uniref:Uncharacterized protein n=1 Tax=Capitella teleta TaxID=283909 RepID=R7TN77_CAPTE|nr:hypothetical protein CAPTEDRAFT_190074 [Capitella teleta]|eukprot:ELT95293.1 hypothetical protein CAPTEDRAFT_190074 [Capitella teleta]